MPVGFQVFGSHGIAQVDENYKNMVVVAQGSKAIGDWAFAGGTYFVNVVVSNFVAPLIAYNSGEGVALGYSSISGSNWTFVFLANNPSAFSYWVFDQSPASSPESVGIEVYNGAGERVYHSSQKPMRVVGVGPGVYASGKTYAVIRGDGAFSWSTEPTGLPFPEEYLYQDWFQGAGIINGNEIFEALVSRSYQYSASDVGNYNSYVSPTLVVDVTYF